jgi:hypothetical protein
MNFKKIFPTIFLLASSFSPLAHAGGGGGHYDYWIFEKPLKSTGWTETVLDRYFADVEAIYSKGTTSFKVGNSEAEGGYIEGIGLTNLVDILGKAGISCKQESRTVAYCTRTGSDVATRITGTVLYFGIQEMAPGKIWVVPGKVPVSN